MGFQLTAEYKLNDANPNGIGALATFKGFGQNGEIASAFSYNVIWKNILESDWTRVYEYDLSSGPYVYSGMTQAGYDDAESIRQKALMVKNVNFGGVMLFSLDHDDHSNL